ncbi:MAG: hypothetical protein KGI04_01590 [Candidatus Micrarchaeota archaeon]|nr:hypothetical protein [Candidatus Micrarchaeota archaeon]
MKILVLSNVLGSVDKIVDVLHDRHNVVAKEANMAESTMAGTAADQLNAGTYDQVIVVARDPIQAGMLLNKKEGVDAAVCGSVDDVTLAKSNGANAIVIRDIDADSVHEIVAQAAGISLRGLRMPQMHAQPQQQARPQRVERSSEPSAPLFKMPAFKMPQLLPKQQARNQVQKKAKQPAPEEYQPPRTARSGSMKDKIKDYLGII